MFKKWIERAVSAVVMALTKVAIDRVPGMYKELVNWWNGKSIAIIGPTASGKNSFFNKLKGDIAPAEHIQTRGAENVKTFNFSWPLPNKTEVKFKCKNSINVGGEIDERERFWLQSCTEADVIFYLVDFDKLTNNTENTIHRIKSDFKWIASNIPKFKKESSLFIVINKMDLIFDDGVDPSAIEGGLTSALSTHLENLDEATKKTLGTYTSRISGLGPMSMTDSHIFSICFTSALQMIFDSEGK
ncbi:Rab family GTPase [Serratia fonticola]